MSYITSRALALSAPALLAAALLAPAAHAVPFTVNSLADGPDATPGNGVCQTTTPGQCTFRAAVEEANALVSDDTIGFSITGVHPITAGSGGPVQAGMSGDGNLTITGNGAASSGTVLDAGGAAGMSFVLIANSTGAQTVSLNSLRVQGISASGAGAGILSNGGSLVLNGVTVTANTAGSGAGVEAGAGFLNINDSTISGNTDTSGSPGGGIAASGAVLNLNRSAVTGNSAPTGGGAGIYTSAAGSSITNSTIAGNTSGGLGAIRNDGNPLTITNSTIAGNIVVGSALLALAQVNLGNSILADPGASCGGVGPISSAGNNISTDGTCSLGQPGDKPSTNPQLAALADNGGPTQTMAITSSSPAFDAASNPICAAAPVSGVDQRRVSRPQFSACDIGAFELAAPGVAGSPSNHFKLGKLKLKRNGTATLAVSVPGAGAITCTDLKKKKLIKPARANPKGAATVKLKLSQTSRAKVKFNDGKVVKTRLKLTFTPTGGSANSKKLVIKLKHH